MPLPVIDLYNTIFPKTKKATELEKLSSAGFGLLSGTFFFLPSKELLGGHAPVNQLRSVPVDFIIMEDVDNVHQRPLRSTKNCGIIPAGLLFSRSARGIYPDGLV